MKRYRSKEYILGVTASDRAVHAVLVQDTPDGPVIIRQFERSRTGQESFTPLMPELNDSRDNDFSFKIGDESAAPSPIFLAAEFGGSGNTASEDSLGSVTGTGKPGQLFDLELLDIVAECRDAGYDDFHILFSLGSAFLSTVKLEIASSKRADRKNKNVKKKNGSSKRSAPSKEEYISALESVCNQKVDPLRTAFVPLKHDGDVRGMSLAIMPLEVDPVTSTLEEIRARKRSLPKVDLLDTEITLFLGLARAAYLLKASSEEFDFEDIRERGDNARILFIRAGFEDTLVMFLEGEQLVRFENLRSITSFDPPETIFSRVLLLQDEFGIRDADMVVILAEDREELLIETFRNFFKEASVESVRKLLPHNPNVDDGPLSREGVLAAAVTLRMINDDLFQSVFQDVNLLPRKLLKRKIELPFSWPIATIYVLLFCSSLFFVYRYYDLRHALELYRYELKHYPEEVIQANSKDLQNRIDSLKMRTTGYMHSLDVLDSLLIGSDKWSRALEKTARVTSDVSGIWIETWNERDGFLRLEGTATDRNDVVAFAARADAVIESLLFSTIRDWPVYSFTMRMPLPQQLPEAAKYFRELAEQEKASGSASADAVGEVSTSSD